MKTMSGFESIKSTKDFNVYAMKIVKTDEICEYGKDIPNAKKFLIYTDDKIISNGQYVVNFVPDYNKVDDFSPEKYLSVFSQTNINPPFNQYGIDYAFSENRTFRIYFTNVNESFILYVKAFKTEGKE